MKALHHGEPVAPQKVDSADELPTRDQIEDFLYGEAQLLDEWRLDDWLALFEEGATYHVPATDAPNASPDSSLFLVADDWTRLQARVKRLNSKNAHVENPRSRTRRIITNVRFGRGPEPEIVHVRATFVIYRIRRQLNDVYVGRYDHVLSYREGTLRYRRRRAVLDLDALRPAGKVSIIL